MLWVRNETGDYVCIEKLEYPDITVVERADSSLIRFLQQKNWIVDLNQYQTQPEAYVGLSIPDWLAELPQAWLVIPMMHNETLYGFLVISKPRLNRTVNWEDRDLLKTASKQAASYLVLLQANEALANAEKFAVFNRLSSYVVHDLKNLVAQLDLVVKNADRHRDNPEFIADAFSTVGNATEKMQRLLTQLKKGRFETQQAEVLDLCEIMPLVLRQYISASPVPQLRMECEHCRVAANRDRLVSVLGHLIQNAQEATSDNGFVNIEVEQKNQQAIIRIRDNGTGMAADFIREKLFAPFETTKGNAGMGVGVYESREFLQSLGGSLTVESCVGEGTTFTLTIPLLGGGMSSDHKAVGRAE
jgi:putative PEP-CTERM system histidine kinase